MNFQFMTSADDLPPSACMHYPRFLNDFSCSSSSKLLYCVLLDAAMREGQIDEHGQLFVYFSISDLNEILLRGESTTKRLLHELEENGLLMRQRKRIGKPSKLYLMVPNEKTSIRPTNTLKCQIC